MKKSALCLIPIACLFAACGQNQQIPDDPINGDIEIPDCEPLEIDKFCTNNIPGEPGLGPSNPKVNINVTPPGIVVAPKFVCAMQGSTIEFRVNGPAGGPHEVEAGDVSVIPKKTTSPWLTGTNFPDKGLITITVPDSVPHGSEPEYYIVTNSGHCLDPRIHVM